MRLLFAAAVVFQLWRDSIRAFPLTEILRGQLLSYRGEGGCRGRNGEKEEVESCLREIYER